MVAQREERDVREQELEDGRMPFVEHLRELRVRIRNAAISFVAAFIGCFVFAERIFGWMREPFDAAWIDRHGTAPELYYSSPLTPIFLDMQVALWAAIFVASPLTFYQLWKFIAPGLYKRERRIGVWFAIFSAICFVSGAAFCYYVTLGPMYEFLLGYPHEGTHATIFIDQYFDLTKDLMLAFGAVFEMPMLIFFLSYVGLVTHRSLWKFNRWFVVIAFIVAAILTPSTDPISQGLMAAPMIVLYNLSIVIAWVNTRRRERRAAAERGAEGFDEDA
jgi:sec-independent protein translocase protein TatC